MTTNNNPETSEQTSEPTDTVDTTWSDLTREERQDKFTSSHKGITDEEVREAWDTIGTVSGTAKELKCSKVNARRRLEKLGLKTAPPSRQKSVKPITPLTEEEMVAEVVAAQLVDN
jgi:hypothetical protein